jgi:hypothetical protein
MLDRLWSAHPHECETWGSTLTPTYPYPVKPRSSKQQSLAYFAALRHLRGVRRCLHTDIFKSLVVSLFLSRLDYGNAVLCGLPQYQYRRLQSVLHAVARPIYNLRRYDHVTPALIELHWLSAVNRVNFKVNTLVYRCLYGPIRKMTLKT